MRFEVECDIDEAVINTILVELDGIVFGEEIEFNFSKAGFINCLALNFLLILFNDLIDNHNVSIFFSKSNPLLYYLSRMGFFKELNSSINVEPPEAKNPKFIDKYRMSNDTILEITSVNNIDIYDIINHVFDTLTKILNYNSQYAGNITVLLSELLTNVSDHSQNVESGYVSLQTYKRAGYADLVVVDSGIGILKSLKQNKSLLLTNDIEGIQFAIKKGVSRFDNQNRGMGLNTCLELAKVNRGHLYIRSGSGQLFFKNHKINIQKVSFFAGTQVSVRLPFESTLNTKWGD